MGLVGAGVALLVPVWGAALEPPAWFNGALLTICAADDLLAVLLGGATLAVLREPAPAAAAMLMLQATGVTLVIAAAGWLLLSRSAPGTEQRVFVIALLLLLGGASEYLSLSALTAGLVAGFFWEAVGGSTRVAIRRDVTVRPAAADRADPRGQRRQARTDAGRARHRPSIPRPPPRRRRRPDPPLHDASSRPGQRQTRV